jgi:hypothetical protein
MTRTFAMVSLVVLGLALVPATAAPAAQSAQCFNEIGYCIDDSAFQSYFANRGGARILGFPVSRTFRLEGFNVQFFQRVVLQNQGGNVARLNLLDPGILPVIHANQSTFPAPEPGLASDAPRPTMRTTPRGWSTTCAPSRRIRGTACRSASPRCSTARYPPRALHLRSARC